MPELWTPGMTGPLILVPEDEHRFGFSPPATA
jgi:hypothetical protein